MKALLCGCGYEVQSVKLRLSQSHFPGFQSVTGGLRLVRLPTASQHGSTDRKHDHLPYFARLPNQHQYSNIYNTKSRISWPLESPSTMSQRIHEGHINQVVDASELMDAESPGLVFTMVLPLFESAHQQHPQNRFLSP